MKFGLGTNELDLGLEKPYLENLVNTFVEYLTFFYGKADILLS